MSERVIVVQENAAAFTVKMLKGGFYRAIALFSNREHADATAEWANGVVSEAVEAENARLRLLEPYVQHLPGCDIFYSHKNSKEVCTCGLDKLKGAAPQ